MIQNFNNISTLEKSSMNFSTQSWNLGMVSDMLLSITCSSGNESLETGYPCNHLDTLDTAYNKGRYTCYY